MGTRIRHHVNPLGILKEHHFDGFGDGREIVVDIGAFKGEFVAQMRELFPDRNVIALEVRSRVAEKLEEKFKDDRQVVVFDGDATRNFKSIVKPCQDDGAFVREIYVNFPDPWTKKRHKKRRIITKKFLVSTEKWLSPQTTWIFQTDCEDAFSDTIALLEELGYSYEKFYTSPYDITTDWEDAKVAAGANIYRVRFWAGMIEQEKNDKKQSIVSIFSEKLVGVVAFALLFGLYVLGKDDTH